MASDAREPEGRENRGGGGRILVVCYGNLCRSPMAGALLRARLGPEWEVASAGTHAVGGDPPTPLAREVVREEAGLDMDAQRSAPLTVAAVTGAHHVLTMSGRQAQLAAALAPECRARIRLLGAFAPEPADGRGAADPGGEPATDAEIADPMGGTRAGYLSCLRRIERAVDAVVAWLESGADPEDAPPSVASPHWRRRRGS